MFRAISHDTVSFPFYRLVSFQHFNIYINIHKSSITIVSTNSMERTSRILCVVYLSSKNNNLKLKGNLFYLFYLFIYLFAHVQLYPHINKQAGSEEKSVVTKETKKSDTQIEEKIEKMVRVVTIIAVDKINQDNKEYSCHNSRNIVIDHTRVNIVRFLLSSNPCGSLRARCWLYRRRSS